MKCLLHTSAKIIIANEKKNYRSSKLIPGIGYWRKKNSLFAELFIQKSFLQMYNEKILINLRGEILLFKFITMWWLLNVMVNSNATECPKTTKWFLIH